MNSDYLIKLWGANKLTEYYTRPGIAEYYPNFEVDVESVYVSFYFNEGYACCGGRDPDCYCSLAEGARAEVNIYAGPWSMTIDFEEFDFHKTVQEILDIAKENNEL